MLLFNNWIGENLFADKFETADDSRQTIRTDISVKIMMVGWALKTAKSKEGLSNSWSFQGMTEEMKVGVRP